MKDKKVLKNTLALNKSTSVCLIGLFLVCCALYSYRIGMPEKPYYDEVYHVKTARQFIDLSGRTDTVHPPLGKLLMSASILALGDHPWAWRLPSLICGLATILVIFFITRKLLQSNLAAFFAASLFALDCISMTQARIGMLNTSMMLWTLLSMLAILPYTIDRKGSRAKAFLFSAIFLGLAVGTRWVSLAITPVLFFLLGRRFLEVREKESFIWDLGQGGTD